MEDNIQLSKETLVGDEIVSTDIFPKSNTSSIVDDLSGTSLKELIERLWSAINNKLSRVVNSVNGRTGVVVLTSQDVGLGNVDNVSFGDIKKWVIEQIRTQLEHKRLKLFNDLEALQQLIVANNLNDAESSFFIDHLNDKDLRSYIGYITLSSDKNSLIYNMYPINTIGGMDSSIVYKNKDNEAYFPDKPYGQLGVNISSYEDALYVYEGLNPNESGLRIDKSGFGGKLYYYDGIYGDGKTFDDTALIKPESTSDTDQVCSIYINDTKIGDNFILNNTNLHLNDLIVCGFKDYRSSDNNSGMFVLDSTKIPYSVISRGNFYHLNDIIEVTTGTMYVLTSEIPDGWKYTYTEYYTYDQSSKKYIKLQEQPTAPEWKVNTYYRRDNEISIKVVVTRIEGTGCVYGINLAYCDPASQTLLDKIFGESSDSTIVFDTKPIYRIDNNRTTTYMLLKSKPDSWETTYTKYYTRQLVSNRYVYTQIPQSDEPPAWEENKYYSEYIYDNSVGIGLQIKLSKSWWINNKRSIDKRFNKELTFRGTCIGAVTSAPTRTDKSKPFVISFYKMKPLLGPGLQYSSDSKLHNDEYITLQIREGHINQYSGVRTQSYNISGLSIANDWGEYRLDGNEADIYSNRSGNTVYNPSRAQRYAVLPQGVVPVMTNSQDSSGGLTVMTDMSLCIQPHTPYTKIIYDSNEASQVVKNYYGEFPSDVIMHDNGAPSYVGVNLAKAVYNKNHFVYVKTYEKPSDWDTNYKNYYTKNTKGIYIPITDESVPEWTYDTYYTRHYTKNDIPTTDIDDVPNILDQYIFTNLSGLKIVGRDVTVNKKLLGLDNTEKYFEDESYEQADIDGYDMSGGLMVNVGRGLRIAPTCIPETGYNYYESGKVEVKLGEGLTFDDKGRICLDTSIFGEGFEVTHDSSGKLKINIVK